MNCSVFLLLAGSLAFFAIARGKNLTCYCNQPTKDCIGVNGNSIWGDGQCSMPVGEGVCLAIWGRDPRVIHVYTCSIYLIGQDLSVCHPSGPQLIGLSFITACCQTSYCNTPDYLRSVVNEIDSDITQLLSSTNASGSSNKTQLQSPTNASGRKNLTCYCNQPTGDCIRVIGNSIWGQCSMPVGEGVCLATWGRNPQVAVHTCSSNLIGRDLSVCHPSKPQLIGLSNITACCQTSYCNTPDYLKSVVNELDSNNTQLLSPTNASGKSNNTQLQSPTSGKSNNTQLQSPTNASGRENLTCYCNKPTEDCIRGKCSLPVGQGVCLATLEKIPPNNIVTYTYACGNPFPLHMLCKPLGKHLFGLSLGSSITACCLTNFCNTPDYLKSVVNVLDSNKTQLQSPTNASGSSNKTQLQSPTNASGKYLHTDPLPPSDQLPSSFLPILITSCIIAIIVMVAVLFYVVYKRLAKSPPPGDVTHTALNMENMANVPQSLDSIPTNTAHTSGSGSGHPFLVQRTVARNIRLGDPIGSGRYGQVVVGHHQGEMVAVKKFVSRDEQSWRRETEIYSTVLLRHENILVYIASDIVSNHDVTELWLITQYHSHGSLYDYLSTNQVDSACTVQLLLSIWNGLTHLHTELFGIQGKPAIAHRDMKSRNILVKANLTCCIADFGLAVMKVREMNAMNLPTNHKQGTIRYMAPEILDDSINMQSFESFKHVDVYAVGLVMWEICRRTASSTGQCEEYELPFEGMVPPDPSLLDMRTAVVDEKKQPPIPPRWTTDKLLANVVALMRECWYPNPLARPTALYFKKKLLRLAAEDNN